MSSYGAEEAEGVDFAETHHGGDDELRTVRVVGRVVAIRAMTQRMHRPDPTGPWTNVEGESRGAPVESVPGRTQIAPEAFSPAPTASVDPATKPGEPPPWGGDEGVFIAPGAGWYARRRPRDLLEPDVGERRIGAGWIVWLDVADDATLPEAPV